MDRDEHDRYYETVRWRQYNNGGFASHQFASEDRTPYPNAGRRNAACGCPVASKSFASTNQARHGGG